MTDTVIISIDWNDETNTGVLVVGRKRVNKSVDIINAFSGDEAKKLYQRLITKKDECMK
jgi:hypothetical protein